MRELPYVTAAEAVRLVRSGDRVYIGSNCGQPVVLSTALAQRAPELRDVEIVHLLTFGPAPYCAPDMKESFRHCAFFVAANTRAAVREGRADYIPVFLSEIPALFESGTLKIDVALVAVSPPDDHGYCSLGVSIDLGLPACRNARAVIAEVNPNMPRTLGDSFLHVRDIHAFVEVSAPILEHIGEEPDEVSRLIGSHIAGLVPDGATLQTGIGKIPSAVLDALHDKNDLGVHTEMFSDPLIDLMERGVVNGRAKTLHPGKVVASFAIGSRRLYGYLDDNPAFEFRPSGYVNDPYRICRNDRMVAINGAIEVDLTGQVVADSIGPDVYSGIGGQVDFVRGAARAREGVPVIALPSTAQGGRTSRIVPALKPGAGVVTSRGDVHKVVTEYGVASLHGIPIGERARRLIEVAHPDFRDALREAAKERRLLR